MFGAPVAGEGGSWHKCELSKGLRSFRAVHFTVAHNTLSEQCIYMSHILHYYVEVAIAVITALDVPVNTAVSVPV
jgi:hypothetical protein